LSIAHALAQHFVALALDAVATVDDPDSKSVSIGERIRRENNMKNVTP
jgi:hypothetical protein